MTSCRNAIAIPVYRVVHNISVYILNGQMNMLWQHATFEYIFHTYTLITYTKTVVLYQRRIQRRRRQQRRYHLFLSSLFIYINVMYRSSYSFSRQQHSTFQCKSILFKKYARTWTLKIFSKKWNFVAKKLVYLSHTHTPTSFYTASGITV